METVWRVVVTIAHMFVFHGMRWRAFWIASSAFARRRTRLTHRMTSVFTHTDDMPKHPDPDNNFAMVLQINACARAGG